MVFTQPPHPIRLFYIIASPAQLWRAGTRAFKFEARLGAVKAFGKEAVSTVRGTGLVPLGRMLSARSAVIWACRKVVVGASGPFGIGRYCSSCSPAAGWTALERFQLGDILSLRPPKAWSSSPLAGVSTSIAQGRGHGAGCGAEV